MPPASSNCATAKPLQPVFGRFYRHALRLRQIGVRTFIRPRRGQDQVNVRPVFPGRLRNKDASFDVQTRAAAPGEIHVICGCPAGLLRIGHDADDAFPLFRSFEVKCKYAAHNFGMGHCGKVLNGLVERLLIVLTQLFRRADFGPGRDGLLLGGAHLFPDHHAQGTGGIRRGGCRIARSEPVQKRGLCIRRRLRQAHRRNLIIAFGDLFPQAVNLILGGLDAIGLRFIGDRQSVGRQRRRMKRDPLWHSDA